MKDAKLMWSLQTMRPMRNINNILSKVSWWNRRPIMVDLVDFYRRNLSLWVKLRWSMYSYILQNSIQYWFVDRSKGQDTTEDVPRASLYEISIALKELKNYKTQWADGIMLELLMTGGKMFCKVLQKIFISVIFSWKQSEVWFKELKTVGLFKKSDNIDSIQIWAVFQSLRRYQIDYRLSCFCTRTQTNWT